MNGLDEQTKRVLAVRTVMREREDSRVAGNYVKSDLLRDHLVKR